ncbi:MAG TPA: N-acetylmuramoyl-L-alanine amidase [Acidimicrobiia bacterium]|nr:N-acetylmuramoyl-L-alanine amidase [Acidimicrobiia bacterium]
MAESERITRRHALRLAASAGAIAASTPLLARLHGEHAIDLSKAELALTAIPKWPVPPIITRAQWGANEALRKPSPSYDTTVSKIIVHHTGTPNSVTDYKGLCRSILKYETSGEYIDIAYNWLIDPNGNIYEGRWAQNYPSGTPHIGEKGGANVRGAHALYHNSHTIGIALMGTYDEIDPPAPMLDALVTLITWKCARWGIDPRGASSFLASNGVTEVLPNICGHRDTYSTDCPGQRTEPLLPNIRARVAARLQGVGYWLTTAAGQVVPFGAAPTRGGVTTPTAPIVGIAAHPTGAGYWLAAQDGNVYCFGTAHPQGTLVGVTLDAPIGCIAPTPSGTGYWLLGTNGRVHSFGDAGFHGGLVRSRLTVPVVGLVPTSSGLGYWLYTSDGRIWPCGDAQSFGSPAEQGVTKTITGMAARPSNDGYWMLADDGTVYPFGAAPLKGDYTNTISVAPCVAIAASATGRGYVILRGDGNVKACGDAPNLGGAALAQGTTAVGIAGMLKPPK